MSLNNWDKITVIDQQVEELLNKKKYLLVLWLYEKFNSLLELIPAQQIELVMNDQPNQSGGKGLEMRLEEKNSNSLFHGANQSLSYYWYFKEYNIPYNAEIDLSIKMALSEKMLSGISYYFTKTTSLDDFLANFVAKEINSQHLIEKLASLENKTPSKMKKI